MNRMSERVTFSRSEKLILLMLCEVYDQMKINSENIDHKFVRAAISSGNMWGLAWGFPEVFETTDTPDAVVNETVDILAMWRRLEESYEGLSQEERVWLETEAEPFGKNVRFSGFDNNNEIDYIRAANFLIKYLDKFPNFKDRPLDAHMPTIEAHRRMLPVFEPILHHVQSSDLSAAHIAEVMKARQHPDHRARA